MEIDYQNIQKDSFVLIDIREKNEYDKGHINNSINIPFTYLLINMNKLLQKEKSYVLICETGIKSKKTSEILNHNGYRTYSLIGGYKYVQRINNSIIYDNKNNN